MAKEVVASSYYEVENSGDSYVASTPKKVRFQFAFAGPTTAIARATYSA